MLRTRVILSMTLMIVPAMLAMAEEKSEVYAKVLKVNGTVEAFRGGADKPEALARGDSINIGDKVSTGDDSAATLITKKRKLINLTANSELSVGASDQGEPIAGLGNLSMFANADGRASAEAQAAVRASDATTLLLTPRGGVSRGETLTLTFAPLEEGHRYEVVISGSVSHRFDLKTDVRKSTLEVTEDDRGGKVVRDVPYFAYVKHYNARNVLLGQEKKIAVGLISKKDEDAVRKVEEGLLPLIGGDQNDTVYRTLLAETYADCYLFTDAIELYEEIYANLLPGDEYSRERLKALYIKTADGAKYNTILSDEEKSALPDAG